MLGLFMILVWQCPEEIFSKHPCAIKTRLKAKNASSREQTSHIRVSFESRQTFDIERNGTVADHQFRLGIINCVWDQC